MLLKRGTGSGDETSEGENGKWEHNRENEVPDTGAIFQARFCSNFSFFRSSCSFPAPSSLF